MSYFKICKTLKVHLLLLLTSNVQEDWPSEIATFCLYPRLKINLTKITSLKLKAEFSYHQGALPDQDRLKYKAEGLS